jgi:hypothetical protein
MVALLEGGFSNKGLTLRKQLLIVHAVAAVITQ